VGRKNLLSDLIEDKLTAVNSETTPSLGTRGVVGAMGRSLQQISQLQEELQSQIAAGQAVIEIDPALIDNSFIADRLNASDEHYQSLLDSIRHHGQQVPILVRPHPNQVGRYQLAYGHRRVRALAELGRPVRALVRALEDDELVVAQGQENNARRDLIKASLAVDKTELSRLISVARTIPSEVLEAVGSAPKAGRRRWIELGERLKKRRLDLVLPRLLQDVRFLESPSDKRFQILFDALAPEGDPRSPASWTDEAGRQIATIDRSGSRFTLSFDEKAAPAFGEFLLNQLPELYRAFREQRQSS
jgi:ParB family chromosome partitioning protein